MKFNFEPIDPTERAELVPFELEAWGAALVILRRIDPKAADVFEERYVERIRLGLDYDKPFLLEQTARIVIAIGSKSNTGPPQGRGRPSIWDDETTYIFFGFMSAFLSHNPTLGVKNGVYAFKEKHPQWEVSEAELSKKWDHLRSQSR